MGNATARLAIDKSSVCHS